jgi:hypothetical protein
VDDLGPFRQLGLEASYACGRLPRLLVRAAMEPTKAWAVPGTESMPAAWATSFSTVRALPLIPAA